MADHSRFGSPHPGVRVRRGRSRRRARGVPDGIRHDGSAVLSEGPPRFHRRRHGRFVKSNRGVPLLRLPKPVPEIAGRVLGSARGGNGNAIGNRASGTADGEALYGPRMGFRDGTALLPPPLPGNLRAFRERQNRTSREFGNAHEYPLPLPSPEFRYHSPNTSPLHPWNSDAAATPRSTPTCSSVRIPTVPEAK